MENLLANSGRIRCLERIKKNIWTKDLYLTKHVSLKECCPPHIYIYIYIYNIYIWENGNESDGV